MRIRITLFQNTVHIHYKHIMNAFHRKGKIIYTFIYRVKYKLSRDNSHKLVVIIDDITVQNSTLYHRVLRLDELKKTELTIVLMIQFSLFKTRSLKPLTSFLIITGTLSTLSSTI